MIGFQDLTDQAVETAGVQAILLAQRHPEAEPVYRWFAERSAAELDRRAGLDVAERLRAPMPLIDPATRDLVLKTLDNMIGCEAAREAGLLPDRDLSHDGRHLRREVVNVFATLQATLSRQISEVSH